MQQVIYYLAIFVLTFFALFITVVFIFVFRTKNKIESFIKSDKIKNILKDVMKQMGKQPPGDFPMPGPIQVEERTPEEEKLYWYIENAPLGKFLGYPECCIKEFCDQPPMFFNMNKLTMNDEDRYRASCVDGEYTGFIPCKKHAEEILQGKITLESLIQNRDKNIPPFPIFNF